MVLLRAGTDMSYPTFAKASRVPEVHLVTWCRADIMSFILKPVQIFWTGFKIKITPYLSVVGLRRRPSTRVQIVAHSVSLCTRVS